MPTHRVPFPALSENALTVLQRRYLRKNTAGRISETPDQLFRRVAGNVALAERRYRPRVKTGIAAREFFDMMRRLEFLPNSPTLMNAGGPLQQLSACFVLPIDDSLESIYDALKHQALIHQSGGGTGFSFSRLRPTHDVVASTHGVASGPISFMRIFNASTDVIKQGGSRRGANMGILRIDHPDILEFITIKRQPGELANFNLSVGITDAFLKARARGTTYALINPHTGKAVRTVPAQLVFDQLAESAWVSGEPGVVFLDTINRTQPTPALGTIEATNPCAEQPLLPYESCVLGSINLAKFLSVNGDTRGVDYARLGATIATAVRFLDDVIDMNHYPLPQIESLTTRNRKIGLGVMGFADLLLLLGIPYDTNEALALADQVMRFVQEQAHDASQYLADERGPFANIGRSLLKSRATRRRNATVTTIAPTGTISIIADCSPGIEPLYGVSFVRTVMEDVRLVSIHPEFVRRAQAAGIYSNDLAAELAKTASIQQLTHIPAELRRLFVTAHDVSPEMHVRMQAAFQRHSDSGVSKTINLPNSATVREVAEAFLLAHRLGCKGLTVFRDGSRDAQVMSCTNIHFC